LMIHDFKRVFFPQNGSEIAVPGKPIPRERDLGERICTPLLKYIPATVHPNTITGVNHIVNCVLFVFAIGASSEPGTWQMLCCLLCSVLNVIAMILDSLDGTYARATNQCSKMGELLDHWLDALHVPMIASGIALAAHLQPWALASVVILNAMLYNTQLIIYNTTHNFIDIAGVEAQLGTSALYLVSVVLSILSTSHPLFVDWARCILGIVAAIITGNLVWQFRPQFVHSHMWTSAGAFLLMNILFTVPYLLGLMSVLPFVLTIFFLSFRITGTLVLYSIRRVPYSGVDMYMFLWGVAGIYVQYGHVTSFVKTLFPFLFCVYCTKNNLADLRPHLDMLLAKTK